MRPRLHRLWAATRGYLAMPVVLTRGALYGAVLALGLFASAGTVIGVLNVRELANERSARGDAQRQALRRELEIKIASAQREADLAARTRRLERPSTRELERRLRRELRILRLHPDLLRAAGFPTLLPSSPAPRHPPSSPSTPRPPTSRRPTSPAPPANTGHPPAAGPPPTSQPAPPTSPPPAVTITVPPGLPIPCAGLATPLVAVVCP